MSKAVRWTVEQCDAYVKRRLAEASFEREMAVPAPVLERPKRPPIEGRLYPLVMLCEAHGLPHPQPEYAFHPTRGWRFDYAFVYQKIYVEVDGGAWISGRHNRGAGFIEDQRKLNEAAALGWRGLRVTPDRLGEAIECLKRMLR